MKCIALSSHGADPAVIAGVFTYHLEPTIVDFDAFSGVRTTNDVATLEQSR